MDVGADGAAQEEVCVCTNTAHMSHSYFNYVHMLGVITT